MKIVCCYTARHEVLFRDFFLPSLPAGFELDATCFDDLRGPGDFRSGQFMDCLRRKIDLLLGKLAQYRGEIIVCSDVDILFFRPVQQELGDLLARENLDIVFQSEAKGGGQDINGGFYACRASRRTEEFFRRVGERMDQERASHDQDAINGLLREGTGDLRWGYLPPAFYARTHGWPPPRELAIYHANETVGRDGVSQKISQFQELRWIRRHGAWARAWSCATKIPKRLARLRREISRAHDHGGAACLDGDR